MQYRINMRKHIFNETFFENIDTEEKAYWLGFICADGYINKRGSTVGITLDVKDKMHLEKFLKALDSNLMRLDFRKGQYNKSYKSTDKVYINLYSKKMNSDLRKIGLTEFKSRDLKELLIKLNKELTRHFIRGYFDGDGCVFDSYIKYGKLKEKKCYSPGFTFVGTKEFLDYINFSLPITVKNLTKDKRTQGSYTLYIRSMKRFKIIEKYLYENSTIYLERKKKKCEEIKSLIEKSSTTMTEMSVESSDSKWRTS